jgi:penicillin-binding protein 2
MKSAFANSCNPYFISLGLSVGKERLLSLSSLFGLGKPIELCNGIVTASGNLPLSDDLVTRGDLANVSFGQGALMATPIHIAKLISIIANGGYLIEPTLVLGEVDQNGDIARIDKASQKTRVIDKDIARKIREYMIYTVTHGTGRSASPKALGAGGKTASAETGWSQGGENMVQGWFSGFYPAEDPKYAIVILCEGGNSGAAACAPAFKKICDLLYEKGYCD